MIADNDYNLNIRRYVDNTPDPEAEDVQAHLIGGIPNQEIEELKIQFAKFGLKNVSGDLGLAIRRKLSPI